MGNLLSYSGISTKIRAMQSRLITDEQLQEILQLENVQQVTGYLKKTPGYLARWASVDENQVHRELLEKMLKSSIFEDFSKIYKFANGEQRKFLELYSKRYEIRALKSIMTNLFDHRDVDPVDVSPYRDFFRRHSKLDLDALAACTTMDEFVNALKEHEFYEPLSMIQNRESALLFDYGMALDLYYFGQIWKVRKKLFSGKDLEEITHAYGEKFDMLNLQFIYRSKQYFQMAPADVYALLIPMNYKLKKDEISALVEAPSLEEARTLFRKTYYGRKYEKLASQNLEEFYNYMLRSILEKEARQNPHSVAILYSYMYHKEHEVSRIIIALECVRYKVPVNEAMQLIYKN